MAINESNKLSKKYRVLDHVDSNGIKWWNRLSFWSKAADVEFANGSNAQTTLGSIKGITTSKTVTEQGYAADATVINELNTNVNKINTSLNAVEGTLAIGATSITLTDARLTATSNIIPMTSKWGVNPLTITKNVGNVVMTFPAQTEVITVGVEIHG